MRRSCRPFAPLAAVALAALELAGCSSGNKFPPACPALSLLPDAADLTRYRSAGQDITDLEVDARITAVPAKCSQDEPGRVTAVLRVAMTVQRGPAATGNRVALPYFVAVTDGGRVLDKQDYTMLAEFPTNINQAVPTGEDVQLVLPVTQAKSAAAYSIYVGYVLTPEELALNRKRGPR